MSWGEVKKINSDMSTSLDKLIIGNKKLTASDGTLAVILSGTKSTDDTVFSITLGTFTPKVSGNIRFVGYLRSFDGVIRAGLDVKDSSNNTITSFHTYSEEFESFSRDINIEPNETYTFTLTGGAKYKYVYALGVKVCGQIVDGATFDYTSI